MSAHHGDYLVEPVQPVVQWGFVIGSMVGPGSSEELVLIHILGVMELRDQLHAFFGVPLHDPLQLVSDFRHREQLPIVIESLPMVDLPKSDCAAHLLLQEELVVDGLAELLIDASDLGVGFIGSQHGFYEYKNIG